MGGWSGANGSRTRGLSSANAALYHLSYSPLLCIFPDDSGSGDGMSYLWQRPHVDMAFRMPVGQFVCVLYYIWGVGAKRKPRPGILGCMAAVENRFSPSFCGK